MKKHTPVLFVEDSTEDIEMTLAALAGIGAGCEVSVVNDGEEALDYLYRRGRFSLRALGNPGVILLDLKMPKVDGLDVLRAVRADDQLRLIPVVMLTSSREERDVTQSYRLGANAYVVKPVGYAEFLKAVDQIGQFWTAQNEPPPGTIGRLA